MSGSYGQDWNQDPRGRGDRDMGRDCLRQAAASDWLEWQEGSTLFFWRWPPYARSLARDGHPPWLRKPLPHYRVPQRAEQNPGARHKIYTKLNTVRNRGYIRAGSVVSLTGYFAVPKGDDDIRLVYDASKSGLNSALWVPSFSFPTADSLTNLLTQASWMVDLDLGEHFLNFNLHPTLRPYCGIDLKPILDPTGKRSQTWWERWERCMMGLRSSPYVTIKQTHLGFEVANGNRLDPKNALRWERAVLNLPGDPVYQPLLPWAYRVRSDGELAGFTLGYVDDLRPVGCSENACWVVLHQTASRLGYLRIQNASRKTRPPSQAPGAWAGTITSTDQDGVGIKCDQAKWEKAQCYLQALRDEVAQEGTLDRKGLKSKRGFFIHLQRTYPAITPFLKGIHLTLNGWRPNRDSEMWKSSEPPEDSFWNADTQSWTPLSDDVYPTAPLKVSSAPRLCQDLESLTMLFRTPSPPVHYLRPTTTKMCLYGFVDASGAGFGSSFHLPNNTIWFRQGIWGRDADNTSSNYRELRNLVEALEEGIAQGALINSEVFVFMDNSIAEGAYYRGNSPSKTLFALELRLRPLDLHGPVKFHLVHVTGTRMMAQGTDALSRGVRNEGVMGGLSMLSFVPLHLSAVQQSPGLLPWVQSWCPTASIEPLTPSEWFERGHGISGGQVNMDGMWWPSETQEPWLLWMPPPGAGAAALEELTISRHKRTCVNHIFICPHLMTQYWRCRLHRLADIVISYMSP
jgi:hypothetical protein